MAQQPKGVILIMEFMNNQDLDDNGMIYGYDFRISGDFPDKPKVLVSTDSDPDFLSLDTSITMTWDEYLNYGEDFGHAVTLMQEYKSNDDMDGNTGIYGQDFYISDPPSLLSDLEEDENWGSPSIVITWVQYLENITSSYLNAVLVAEFNTTSDLDGNIQVYGTDFKISDGDYYKTSILDALEGQAGFTPFTEVSWSEYMSTLP